MNNGEHNAPEEGLQLLNLWLAGRSYRIKVPHQEAKAVAKAVAQADDQVKEMRLHYAGKDDQDFIAMVLLTYAAQQATTAPASQDALRQMIDRIDNALEE